METIIYHITTASEWKKAVARGYYEATSLPAEGFIHCSVASQVAGVLQRYFSDKTGLVKLVIDTAQLTHQPVYELAPSVNEEFPHIYGVINLDAVIEVIYL